jgi:hypothetical protein
MKLLKLNGGTWQYTLEQIEAVILKDLLTRFPFTIDAPVIISKNDADPKSIEREKLLNESLIEHRKGLKKQAECLVSSEKLKAGEKGHLMILSGDEREILLQILNDIRVGCWQALGEPESCELNESDHPKRELLPHHIMNLAGYFEHHLIGLE